MKIARYYHLKRKSSGRSLLLQVQIVLRFVILNTHRELPILGVLAVKLLDFGARDLVDLLYKVPGGVVALRAEQVIPGSYFN